MRIKLDENIPSRLADDLNVLGHDVDSVASEGLTGRPDIDVWNAAQRDGRFLITQDLDFPTCVVSSLEHITACCWYGYESLVPMRS